LASLKTPPSPISTQDTQILLADVLNNLFTLGPSSLPSGTYGTLSIQQHPVTQECLQDIGNILIEEAPASAFLLALGYYVPILEPVLTTVHGMSLVSIQQELLSAYTECWYSQSVSPVNNPVLNITSLCFGVNCILIPQLQSPPAPPTALQLAPYNFIQAASVEPPVASVETYVSSGTLGGVVVGTTDSSGSGSVDVPLGTDTVCVDAPGYQQFSEPGFIVSAPGTLDVTLTPIGSASGLCSVTSIISPGANDCTPCTWTPAPQGDSCSSTYCDSGNCWVNGTPPFCGG
jgi:hypothetical protein